MASWISQNLIRWNQSIKGWIRAIVTISLVKQVGIDRKLHSQ